MTQLPAHIVLLDLLSTEGAKVAEVASATAAFLIEHAKTQGYEHGSMYELAEALGFAIQYDTARIAWNDTTRSELRGNRPSPVIIVRTDFRGIPQDARQHAVGRQLMGWVYDRLPKRSPDEPLSVFADDNRSTATNRQKFMESGAEALQAVLPVASVEHGSTNAPKPRKRHKRKIDKRTVVRMAMRREQGATLQQVANEFDVSPTIVSIRVRELYED